MEGIIHVYDVPCLPVNTSFHIQSNDSYQVQNTADGAETEQKNDLQLQVNESYNTHSTTNTMANSNESFQVNNTPGSEPLSNFQLEQNQSYQVHHISFSDYDHDLQLQANESYNTHSTTDTMANRNESFQVNNPPGSEPLSNVQLEQNQSYQVHHNIISFSDHDQSEINDTSLVQRRTSVQDHNCPDAMQNTQLSDLQLQGNESYLGSSTLGACNRHKKQVADHDIQVQENESYQVHSSAELDTDQRKLKLQSSDNSLAQNTQGLSSQRKQSIHLRLHDESPQVSCAEDKTILQTNECYHIYSTAAECKPTVLESNLQLQQNECYGELKVKTDKRSSVSCRSTLTNRDKRKECKSEYQLQVNESYQQHGIGHSRESDMKTTLLQSNTEINLKRVKGCLIFHSLCIVLLLLSTVAATALSLFNLSQQISRRSLISNDLSSDNNISLNKGLVQYDPVTPDIIAQLATTNYNLTQIVIQLDEVSGDVASVQSTSQMNFTLLLNQIEAVKDKINSMQTRLQTELHCGPGIWVRAAHINMSDPQEQCPSGWREYERNNVRVCGRSISSTGSCSAQLYPINHQYSRVCGRIIGYQFGNPDAFSRYASNITGLDGVTITYGAQQHHIWSYAAGITEGSRLHLASSCPCTATYPGTASPQYIGNNYHCESGNPHLTAAENHPYFDDPLWDGQQCEGTCCTDKDPPWFSVQLPNPTTDMIEVRICADGSTSNEDIPIGLLEIYLQ